MKRLTCSCKRAMHFDKSFLLSHHLFSGRIVHVLLFSRRWTGYSECSWTPGWKGWTGTPWVRTSWETSEWTAHCISFGERGKESCSPHRTCWNMIPRCGRKQPFPDRVKFIRLFGPLIYLVIYEVHKWCNRDAGSDIYYLFVYLTNKITLSMKEGCV